MRYRFSHPDAPNARRPVHSYTMLRLLGVRKLPFEGMPARMLPGDDSNGQHVEIRVWVSPLVGEAPRSPSGYARKRSAHRVRCTCPGCGVELSAGRLFQHECRTSIEKRVAQLVARGWSVDIVFIPEQCAAMYDPEGKAWHVEIDGESPMPEAVA